MKKILCFTLLFMSASPLLAAEVAGQIGYMSGALVAQRTDGTIRVMAPKSQVQEGDVLVTSKDGYAQVKMNDGTMMTMRPDSNLKIEAYQYKKEAPQADNAVFRLLKGGFRTVTGLIGKRGNPDAYKLRAATSTIGIRGTDFTTRLCNDKDCQDSSAKPQPPVVQPVGRVMLLQGEMAAKDAAGKVRKLLLGSPVYEGDTLNTNIKTNAVVAFRDESRITLQESSSFFVEKFKYDKAAPEKEGAVLRLLKGSVRVVTGLIGRVNHDNYKFGVAGATIGIRGTGFDAWCNGGCARSSERANLAQLDSGETRLDVPVGMLAENTDFPNPGATQDNPLDGAGVYVWSGAVVFVTPGASFDVALQQAAIISRSTGKPVPIFVIPKSIIENGAPRPDSIPVDFNKEFGSGEAGGAGLYVTVHDGQVILTQGGNSLNLGSGENGFANDQFLMRLATPPAFLTGDTNHQFNGGTGGNANGCTITGQ